MALFPSPRQLLRRSLDWFRDEPPPAGEAELARVSLAQAILKVTSLPRFALMVQATGSETSQANLAISGCEHSLVTVVARGIRKRVSLTDEELAACFSLLNAYRRAHPYSSRASL